MERLPLRIGGFTVRDNTAETQELLTAVLERHYQAERLRRREWFSALLLRLVTGLDAAELGQCEAELEAESLANGEPVEAARVLDLDMKRGSAAGRRERVPVGYDRLHDPRD